MLAARQINRRRRHCMDSRRASSIEVHWAQKLLRTRTVCGKFSRIEGEVLPWDARERLREMKEGNRGSKAGRGLEAFLVRFWTMRQPGVPPHAPPLII